jgi:hypothetical protein
MDIDISKARWDRLLGAALLAVGALALIAASLYPTYVVANIFGIPVGYDVSF